MKKKKDEPPPEFFVDRSLGKSIAEALRATGLTVHTMDSVYGEEEGQQLDDRIWLRDAGAKAGVGLWAEPAGEARHPAQPAAASLAILVAIEASS